MTPEAGWKPAVRKTRLSLPLRHRLGHALGAQLRELLRLEAQQLRQHLLRMLPQRRRGTPYLRLAAGVQADGRDRHARAAAPRMVDVDPEAASLEMRIA